MTVFKVGQVWKLKEGVECVPNPFGENVHPSGNFFLVIGVDKDGDPLTHCIFNGEFGMFYFYQHKMHGERMGLRVEDLLELVEDVE